MKKALLLLCFLATATGFSQPKTELTSKGFTAVQVPIPDIPSDKITDAIRAWASEYNKSNEYGYDVYDVTETSISIDSQRDNAFYYTNRGETYYHRIKYSLKIERQQAVFKVTFVLKEVYTKRTLTEITVADFFAPDGRLKEDYVEVKPSLEKTANNILKSFANYMAQAN